MNKKRVALIVFLALVVLWNVTVIYVDSQIQGTRDGDAYSKCHKIWTSRGVFKKFANENTVPSIQRAFDKGAPGVEVDFHYDVKMDRFIISHNHPVKASNGELVYEKKKNGAMLTMQELFESLKEGEHYFWLDYKNLDKLSKEETLKSIERLNTITKGSSLRERLYIEGSNPLKLPIYTDAGLKTILGIHPVRESYFFSSIVINAYKIAYYFTNITGIALAYGDFDDPVYGQKTQESFGNIPIFLFHVPHDRALLRKLVDTQGVRVVLLSAKESLDIDFNDINTCED